MAVANMNGNLLIVDFGKSIPNPLFYPYNVLFCTFLVNFVVLSLKFGFSGECHWSESVQQANH